MISERKIRLSLFHYLPGPTIGQKYDKKYYHPYY